MPDNVLTLDVDATITVEKLVNVMHDMQAGHILVHLNCGCVLHLIMALDTQENKKIMELTGELMGPARQH